MNKFLYYTVCAVLWAGPAFGQQASPTKDRLALTPPMGWSSWNTFKKEPSEVVLRQTADALVASGLQKVGYTYINVDDFWSTGRDASGNIRADSAKFPSGMKALADYIHSKGLKAGIYTNIGTKANYATLASGGYYAQDMKTFADWGFDYVKVDVNFAPERTEAAYKKEFSELAQAIAAAGRPMLLSICNQGGGQYQNWAPALGNTWRVGADIDHMPKGSTTQWAGVLYELDKAAAFPEIAGPGHWNDADMLLVGVGSDGGRLMVMTPEEQKSHFSMWCLLASPLILGNDLRSITPETLAIVTNREAIAVDQDPLGQQGKLLYEQAPGLQVWAKKLASKNGEAYAVALFNRSASAAEIGVDFNKLGVAKSVKVRDLWAHKDLGKFSKKYAAAVPSHGVLLLLLH
ncbi:glycoside hydrolase family 27 protein [Hymenobacter jejuensis]|uniref:Alpha-galactosidase n=1 Tax=Hymenobacter jejuensis TaxID=2502781 RepID=A0A5B8A381_9BACT|nr:glycoside hydrolase family 27 protein [Hymenobacter jejuensis]QDA61627.1 glycoside hydrolase family 27 protein [Hymenobacter jejuensis]